MSKAHPSATARGIARGLAAALLTVLPLAPVVAHAAATDPIVPTTTASAATGERFIIKLREPMSDLRSRLFVIGSRAGRSFTYLRAMSGGAHVVVMGSGTATTAATIGTSAADTRRLVAQQLMLDPEIAYAEPDLVMHPLLTPNDVGYNDQWNYYEAAGGINLPAAWNITTGSTSIVVAVIDTGIRPHVEFTGRTVPGYDFIGDTSVSNDGDGRDADPSDPGDYGCGTRSSWHGTHVSGTIGAASNNGAGVAGVNWVSKILPARVLGVCGGYTSDIADAMRWSSGIAVSGVPANANPARVENLSLGGSGNCSNTFQSAINDVVTRGTVVVVAAGNENADASTSSPANCANVIAVGATTRTGARASFSNYGSTVAISAPGAGILSTYNDGQTTPGSDNYAMLSGTSMSTPHVAGVVSLMLSQNPSLTPAQVKTRLQQTARAFPTGTGADCTVALCGAGIVDAGAALVAPAPTARVNYAAQSNGGVASASSSYNAGYGPAGVNNGDRRGANWQFGGGWNDATSNSFPDWVRVDLASAQSLTEIDVYTLQDNYNSPVEPTDSMTFSQYGITAFDVQYWNGSAWVTVPNGSVTNNNKVVNRFTFDPIVTTAVRVQVNAALAGYSRVVEVEAFGAGLATVNAARPANGGSVTASSTYSAGYPASGATDGDRAGRNWQAGGGWNDATGGTFPDQLQVTFNATKAIGEIDVFTVQDAYSNPQEPTLDMTFSQYGIVDFDVQYWNGSSWVTIPNGAVNGNNKVWRKFTFTPISTTAIRVNVRNALGGYSRITEIEAYVSQ